MLKKTWENMSTEPRGYGAMGSSKVKCNHEKRRMGVNRQLAIAQGNLSWTGGGVVQKNEDQKTNPKNLRNEEIPGRRERKRAKTTLDGAGQKFARHRGVGGGSQKKRNGVG